MTLVNRHWGIYSIAKLYISLVAGDRDILSAVRWYFPPTDPQGWKNHLSPNIDDGEVGELPIPPFAA